MDVGFFEALLIVGLLLAAAAALSGLMHGTVLSISILAAAAGAVLALTDVIHVGPESPGLIELIELALLLTLFSDGLAVERELLRSAWRTPLRALVVALPLTILMLGLVGKLLFDLSWGEAFLLGAVLAPTDPVITSSVVGARRVPERVRHALNLESGLNDGLALPIVLVLLAVVEGTDAGSEALQLSGEALAGAAIGAVLGYFGGWLVPRVPGGISRRYEGLYALGIALIAYAGCELTVGNGLVASFVAGITLGLARHDMPEAFTGFSENISAIFQVVTFAAFGALIVATGFEESPLALAAFVVFAIVVARPASILIAFVRSPLPRASRAFIAWFGPKGVASMLFALFVLESQAPDRSVVFDVAALVIVASILAHGLTDTLGARWIERRVSGEGEGRST